MDFYVQKYKEGAPYLVLKSLTYFEDAEKDDTPRMFETIDWEEIKTNIKATVQDYLTT